MTTRVLLLLWTLVTSALGAENGGWLEWKNVQSSLSKASNKFIRATESVEDFLFGEACPFVDNPAEAVRDKLKVGLKAQPLAIKAVSDHIKAWYSTNKPLVLAFTGPTGVGKTETANLVAEAVLKKKARMGKRGTRTRPKGLVLFEGADFADTSLVKQYKRRITSELAKIFRKCGNRAVIIFDEIQKVAPGTLDVLIEAMSERPRLTYYNHKTEDTEHYDTSKVIFLLISDVGGSRMFEMVQEQNGREHVSKGMVQREIGRIMRSQWDRLQFTQKIGGTVPFLPLEEEHVREVLQFKLEKVRDDGKNKNRWKDVEWTNEFLEHMTTIRNNQYGIVYKRYLPEGSAIAKPRVFAKYGARNIIQSEGPLSPIQTKLNDARRSNKNAIIQLDVVKNEDGATKAIRVDVCHARESSNGGGATSSECGKKSSGNGIDKTCRRLVCTEFFNGDLKD